MIRLKRNKKGWVPGRDQNDEFSLNSWSLPEQALKNNNKVKNGLVTGGRSDLAQGIVIYLVLKRIWDFLGIMDFGDLGFVKNEKRYALSSNQLSKNF